MLPSNCSLVFLLLFSILNIPFVVSLSLPLNASSTKDEIWHSAVKKGAFLFRQLRSGCYPDDPDPVTVADLLVDNWRLNGWPPTPGSLGIFSPVVARMFRWTIEKDYYTVDAARRDSKTPFGTDYNNIYSPRNGLIAAYDNHKAPNEPLFWSDVAFALWTTINSYTRGDIRSLRYIARAWVANEFTRSVIHSVLARTQSKRMAILTPSDEAFLAMLGTPNGAGCVYLLMEHKQALGFKTISRVVVGYDGPTFHSPFIVYEVIAMPSLVLADVGGGSGVCNSSGPEGLSGSPGSM